jgi:hypothetical protein
MLLLAKLLLVPAFVAGVTVAGRRWGTRVGGVLTALPMVAGPALVFYALEQGDDFASEAARMTLLGILATAAWCVAYAHSARRARWPLSLAIGCLAFAAVGAVVSRLDTGRAGALLLTVAGLLAAHRVLPALVSRNEPLRRPEWDLPMRMATAVALVLALTSLAAQLGPSISGLLAAFPVVTVIVGAFTHAQQGPAGVAAYFRGLLRGLHSFALFCVTFSAALGALHLGLVTSTLTALAAQLTTQALLLWRVTEGSATSTVPVTGTIGGRRP